MLLIHQKAADYIVRLQYRTLDKALPTKSINPISSGGCRISPRGAQTLRGGREAPTYDLAEFSWKLHESEWIWMPGGGEERGYVFMANDVRFTSCVNTLYFTDTFIFLTRKHSCRDAYCPLVGRIPYYPCISGGVCPPGPRCRPPMHGDPIDVHPQLQTCRRHSPLKCRPPVMWSLMHSGKPTHSADRMTHACENITSRHTSFVGKDRWLNV